MPERDGFGTRQRYRASGVLVVKGAGEGDDAHTGCHEHTPSLLFDGEKSVPGPVTGTALRYSRSVPAHLYASTTVTPSRGFRPV
ncbi:hypothetical protein GCM10028793_38130 [Nocardiopsis oceani]